MENTFTQLHIQFVFAVRFRQSLILPSWKEKLHQYITGIVENSKHKMLQVNSMPDHVHLFIGLRPHQAISTLVQGIKTSCNTWINNKRLNDAHFAWQEGYGAFSYSKSHVDRVIRYIQNQDKHHGKMSFLEEYKLFLDNFKIEYDERNIFKEPV